MNAETTRPKNLTRDEALVCANGHVVNWFSKWATLRNKNFCPECGSKTQSSCSKCKTPIPGGLRHLGLADYETGDRETLFTEPGRPIPAYCPKCGAAFPWAGKQSKPALGLSSPQANIIIGSPGANMNIGGGNIHQEATWQKHLQQQIEKTTATEDEKREAKSLLEKITSNPLLNTIVGSALSSVLQYGFGSQSSPR